MTRPTCIELAPMLGDWDSIEDVEIMETEDLCMFLEFRAASPSCSRLLDDDARHDSCRSLPSQSASAQHRSSVEAWQAPSCRSTHSKDFSLASGASFCDLAAQWWEDNGSGTGCSSSGRRGDGGNSMSLDDLLCGALVDMGHDDGMGHSYGSKLQASPPWSWPAWLLSRASSRVSAEPSTSHPPSRNRSCSTLRRLHPLGLAGTPVVMDHSHRQR